MAQQDQAENRRNEEEEEELFGASTLPEETGKDRKIIWEGCLIGWEGGGGGRRGRKRGSCGDGWFFHCRSERTVKSN